MSSDDLSHVPDGHIVKACGILILRQMSKTADGTMSVSLEDEFGATQMIVWKDLHKRQHKVALSHNG